MISHSLPVFYLMGGTIVYSVYVYTHTHTFCIHRAILHMALTIGPVNV